MHKNVLTCTVTHMNDVITCTVTHMNDVITCTVMHMNDVITCTVMHMNAVMMGYIHSQFMSGNKSALLYCNSALRNVSSSKLTLSEYQLTATVQ